MKSTYKMLYLTVVLSLAASFGVFADEDVTQEVECETQNLLPEWHPDYSDIVKNNIEIIKGIDAECLSFLSGEIQEVRYNENGTLKQVFYANGITVDYFYTYNENGELATCQLKTSNGLSITVAEGNKDSDGNYYIQTPDGKLVIEINYLKANDDDKLYFFLIRHNTPGFHLCDDSGNDSNRNDDAANMGDDNEPQIVIPFSAGDKSILDDISTKPIDSDFINSIKDALNNLKEERDAAYDEYVKETAPYYNYICSTLKEKFDALKAEGIDLSARFDKLSDINFEDEKERIAIEEVVELIRSEAEEGGKPVASEFLIIEKECRTSIFKAGEEIYNNHIEKALAYVNDMIDKLLGSKAVLYLNLTKDKNLDAIIRLPEKKKPQKE
ncbi:MAG: hypothetical protein JW994_07020 [Candidatus Omnitrophica bacterium]|nr:hypothetical protein [Candidatus Omnitrophota bacterium]